MTDILLQELFDINYVPCLMRKEGVGKMWQLFGEEMDIMIKELNEILVA